MRRTSSQHDGLLAAGRELGFEVEEDGVDTRHLMLLIVVVFVLIMITVFRRVCDISTVVEVEILRIEYNVKASIVKCDPTVFEQMHATSSCS